MDIAQVVEKLKAYNGTPLKIMEVCGTHTAAIFKNGIRSLISPKIKLISGPGCPVCVTPAAYIDKCLNYALMPDHVVYSFGDMLKVCGTKESLADVKGQGGQVRMIYSPLEVIEAAKARPEVTHILAAVGFETTAPLYGLVVKEAAQQNLTNIKLLTALKTIMPALDWLCGNQADINGFICPGHVTVITGLAPYKALAQKYQKPFVTAGFEAEHILTAIYRIIWQIENKKPWAENLYPAAVRDYGNAAARQIIADYFSLGDGLWRGLGLLKASAYYLKGAYAPYDAGSTLLTDDPLPKACRCAQVITGQINPPACPLFVGVCNPGHPVGPCMVSAEGACGIWYQNRGV